MKASQDPTSASRLHDQVTPSEPEQVGRKFVLRGIRRQGTRCLQVLSLVDAIVKHIGVRYYFYRPLIHQYAPSSTRLTPAWDEPCLDYYGGHRPGDNLFCLDASSSADLEFFHQDGFAAMPRVFV